MNTKDIQDMARLSGATDERGGKAETVFCFTEQELNNFSTLIAHACIDAVRENYVGRGSLPGIVAAVESIENLFGVK